MINIDRLLPAVQHYFPKVAKSVLLKKMQEFAKAYPNISDEQAIQMFGTVLQNQQVQKTMKKGPSLQNYLGS